MLGVDLCRVNSDTQRERLLKLLNQMNETRFPLSMCPLSPEYPQWISSNSFLSPLLDCAGDPYLSRVSRLWLGLGMAGLMSVYKCDVID